MSSPPSWTVVVFEPTKEEEHESVQAVPSKWIEGDQCFWPSLPAEKLNVAIRKCHFNTCWPRHKVRTLRNSTFNDYALARKKAKKAELTSDLGTDDEDEFTPKKRTIKPLHYLSDSDSDDVVTPKQKKLFKLPLPPKIQRTGDIYENLDTMQMTSNKHQYDFEEAFTKENEELFKPPTTTRYSTSNQNLSAAKDSQNKVYCDCKKDIYFIKNLLVEVNGKLDHILLLQSSREEPSEREGDILSKVEVSFPIKTEDDLRKLEAFLEDKSNFSSVVNYLSKFGGVNLTEFLRRCLQPTLSDDIALLYSLKGRKQKEQFDTLQLCRAVVEAAELTKLAKNKKETELAIGAWLRRAQERKRRDGLRNLQ